MYVYIYIYIESNDSKGNGTLKDFEAANNRCWDVVPICSWRVPPTWGLLVAHNGTFVGACDSLHPSSGVSCF